jgi:hypothetical protein
MSSMESLLKANVASGALTPNSSDIERLFSRMLASGAPSARTGQSEQTFLQGYNSSVGNMGPGGSIPLNLLTTAAMHGHTPKTDADLQKFLHMKDSDYAELKKQPASKRIIDDYLAAAQRGDPNALTYLGELMKGHPDLAKTIIDEALPGVPQYLKDKIGANAFGTGIAPWVQNASGRPSMGLRNNNPLNLSATNQPGLVGFQRAGDGERVGTFATMEAGIAAAYNQILTDENKAGGTISIRQLLDQWSPNGQFNDQHAAMVAKNLGLSPDQQMNLAGDDGLSARLMREMANVEGSGGVAKGAFHRGIALAQGHPDDNGNSQTDVNQMTANTGAAQTNAAKDVFSNFANSAIIKDLESGLSKVSTTVVNATGGLEKAFSDAAAAIERGGLAISHAMGGAPGPRVAPNGTLHYPSPLGNSMQMGVLK